MTTTTDQIRDLGSRWVDAELSAGNKDGYAFRYRIVPAAGNLSEEEANQAARFELAATPVEYGKTGRRSFFVDQSAVLRGDDHGGAPAGASDNPVAGP